MHVYLFILTITSFFVVVHQGRYSLRNLPYPISSYWAMLLSVVMVGLLSFHPITLYDDKYNYLHTFLNITEERIETMRDIGWGYYTYLVKILFADSDVYFVITAMVYVGGTYIYAMRSIPKQYLFLFLLVSFASLGFWGYGVNTLRAGFALSLLLLAISYRQYVIPFCLLAGAAVLCHKSVVVPLVCFALTRFNDNTKMYISIWGMALILSLLDLKFIQHYLQVLLMDDIQSIKYLTKKMEYQAGFRTDFVIYSFIPIVVGYYYVVKQRYRSVLYIRILHTYLLTNAVWLLVIRMNFTDRVAYLSWFLIPTILLFPILTVKLPINQRKVYLYTMSGVVLFTVIMNLR